MIAAGAVAASLSCLALVLAASSGAWGPKRVDLAWRHPDRAALADLGWGRRLREWELLRMALLLGAGGFALLGAPAGLVPLAAVAPSLWVRDRARSGRERARRDTTAIVTAASVALASGAALVPALRLGLQQPASELARRPFVNALAAFSLGAALDVALRDARRQERDPRVSLALETLALGVGERLPTERVARLVGATADRLRHEERLDDEVRARAGGARMQVRLLALLVPVLALYLAATTPGVAGVLLGPVGRTVLMPTALALEVLGIVLSRRVVSAVGR